MRDSNPRPLAPEGVEGHPLTDFLCFLAFHGSFPRRWTTLAGREVIVPVFPCATGERGQRVQAVGLHSRSTAAALISPAARPLRALSILCRLPSDHERRPVFPQVEPIIGYLVYWDFLS